MCIDPISALTTAATIGGTALSIGGSLASGTAQRQAGRAALAASESQARIAAQNAHVAELNVAMQQRGAEAARDSSTLGLARGNFDAAKTRELVDRTLDGQTAFFAKGGLDPTAGSAAWLAGSTAAQGEADAQLAVARGRIDSANALAGGVDALTRATNAQGQVADAWQRSADVLRRGNDSSRAGQTGFANSLLSAGSQSLRSLSGAFSGSGGTGNSFAGFNVGSAFNSFLPQSGSIF